MQSDQVKGRFGRCPYCRTMVYQDPKVVIYYCSKCRTPIRGKNPEPANEDEYTLAQLEILSFDTMSVFSDELEQSDAANSYTSGREEARAVSSPYRGFNSIRTGPRSGDLNRNDEVWDGRSGSPSPVQHDRVSELRPASRRTRRPMSADMDAPRDDGSGVLDVPRTSSASCYQRQASPLSSRELDRSMNLSGGHESTHSGLARSPLTDPTFQQNLLHALENLRKLIVAVEEPHQQPIVAPATASASFDDRGALAITRRDSRLLRRLESQLTQALPANDWRQIATTTTSSSSSSSASSSRRGGESLRSRATSMQLYRPVLGGTPYVACDKCSELLQLPAAVSPHKLARLQCGECDEVLEVMLPVRTVVSAVRPRKIFSAPQAAAVSGSYKADGEYARARRHLSGEQLRQGQDEGRLHRELGYSSVLRSRQYS